MRKNDYPYKAQFYYIKVGSKGVFVTRTCFRHDLVTAYFLLNEISIAILSIRHAAKEF